MVAKDVEAVGVIFGFAGALLIGLSQPALAECAGKYPNVICISQDGDVWTPYGYYSSYSDGSSSSSSGSKIAKYPNGAGARPDDKPAAGAGKTIVLQPSAQTGNAQVLTPQSTGGGTVLRDNGSAGGTVCESAGSC